MLSHHLMAWLPLARTRSRAVSPTSTDIFCYRQAKLEEVYPSMYTLDVIITYKLTEDVDRVGRVLFLSSHPSEFYKNRENLLIPTQVKSCLEVFHAAEAN